MKKCKTCGIEKPISEFRAGHARCLVCFRKQDAEKHRVRTALARGFSAPKSVALAFAFKERTRKKYGEDVALLLDGMDESIAMSEDTEFAKAYRA